MIAVCTRCVNLEVSSTIDTKSFLQAWRRFTTSQVFHPNQMEVGRLKVHTNQYQNGYKIGITI